MILSIMLFFSVDRKKKRWLNWIMPFLLTVIIFFLLKRWQDRIENYFPYQNIKGNTILTIELRGKNKLDTITAIYKELSIFKRSGRDLGLYHEANDSLTAIFKLQQNRLVSEQGEIPFFRHFDKSDQIYSVSKAIVQMHPGVQWEDKHIGLIHRYEEDEVLEALGKQIVCKKFISFLDTKTRITIANELEKNIVDKDSLAMTLQEVNGLWLEWYAEDIGWLKSRFPDGREERLIAIDTLYWFERIPRLFGIGVR